MRKIIPNLYVEYGRYIDTLRAIPYYLDSLKPVERRLLLSLGKKFQKSAKVVGHCIGNYHPHGDASTYESLVQLVRRGLVIGKGNFGDNYGLNETKAAAQRYTEVKENPFVRKLCFELIEFVPWEEIELEKEPLYLPSIIPIGLIGSGIITGIGFHITRIPRYKFVDLRKRLIQLMENKTDKPIIPNIGNNLIINSDDFEKILKIGKGTISVIPKYYHDGKWLIIYGKPPIFGFSKLISYAEENNIIINDLSSNETLIRVKIKKDKINEIIQPISINIVCNFIRNNKVETIGIDEILLECFNNYKSIFKKSIEKEILDLTVKLEEYKIILIIREIINKYKIGNSVDDIYKIYDINRDKFPLNNLKIESFEKVVNKYSIRKLLEIKIDIENINKRINECKNKLNKIHELCLDYLKNISDSYCPS